MINKIILVGRLGQDAEMRSTQTGMSVLNFSMATTEKYKTEVQTTWHKCIVWGKHAEAIHPYLKKGTLVYCEGKLTIRNYEDKSGQKKQAVEVVANSVRLLGGGQKNESPQTHQEDHQPPAAPIDAYQSHFSESDIPF